MNLKQTGFFDEIKKQDNKKKIPFLSGYALKTGIHLGHKSLRLSKSNYWHPLMSSYLLGIRHGISLLDPIQTRKCLLRAFYVIALILKTKNVKNVIHSSTAKTNNVSQKKTTFYNNKSINTSKKKSVLQKGHILIVNTNPEFSRLCKNLGVLTLHGSNHFSSLTNKSTIFNKIENNCLSYIHYKWVGGTLTNWKQVSKSVLTYAKFAERCERFLAHSTIDFPRFKKIKECFHGLIRKKKGKVYLAFKDKPDLVFLMNPNENRHIIAEANKKHIPVVALVESNTCLKGISYPIPANAYSATFLYYCLKKILKLSVI